MITTNVENNLFDIVSNSLNVSKDLWIYTIKQCIGYPEITYSICSLIVKRCMQKSIEKNNKVDFEKINKITGLILQNEF